jgi:hypothetical protein
MSLKSSTVLLMQAPGTSTIKHFTMAIKTLSAYPLLSLEKGLKYTNNAPIP